METRLADFMDGIAAASSRSAIETELKSFAEYFESELFALVTTRAGVMDSVSNYPLEWQQRYYKKRYGGCDPVVAGAKRSMLPYQWTAANQNCANEEERNFLSEATDFGIRAGVSIPVQLPFSGFAMLTLATGREKLAADFAKAPSSYVAAVCLSASKMGTTSEKPCSISQIDLTTRQVQCLNWAAQGKSAYETARILRISESAVSFHIKEARKRLKAKSIAQAIRIACKLGQIE